VIELIGIEMYVNLGTVSMVVVSANSWSLLWFL